jgi:biotin synthase-related radical SAM superfamily protein
MATSIKTPVSDTQNLPAQIRVSIGSAMVIGLLEGKLDVAPSTVYLMTHKSGKCTANCGFCPQAKNSLSKAELLSRVSWLAFPTQTVIGQIENAFHTGKIKRVCIQALNYPAVFDDLEGLVKTIKQHVKIPVSVSCQPINKNNIMRLANVSVDRIGIAVDTATQKLFDQVKGVGAGGPYRWANQFRELGEAVEVFGAGNVSTHLIVGLGETEKEAARFIHECTALGVLPALFAFTPVRGTRLETSPQPKMETYRRIQLARHLIVKRVSRFENMQFDVKERITDFGVELEPLTQIAESGEPFLTSGCPNCNRPFYNEKPGGPIYNYPRALNSEETATIKQQLNLTNQTKNIDQRKVSMKLPKL